MFNPATFCLKNNRTTLILYAILMMLGYQTFMTIGRLEYPEFTIRSAQIITKYSGRTALQVEEQVTEPIEQAIRQMSEIKEINSTSKNGISIIVVTLEDRYFDLDPIWQDLRNKVDAVELPDGAGQPNVNDDYGDVFPYVYALYGDGYSDRELLDVAENLRDELLAVPGVAKVEFHGDREEQIFVEFSSSRLAAFGESPTTLSTTIAGQNAVANSGDVVSGPQRLNLMTLGEYESINELKDTRASLDGTASTVRLSDVADIYQDYVDPPSSLCHFQGERVLCIAVSMIKGGVVTEIGDRVQETINTFESRSAIGLDIDTIFFQPVYVAQSIRDFLVNLGQAFFFVVLVMLLFAGYRIAMIVGLLVPSAIMMAFVLMPTVNVLLEMMSIAALIIALGLLVDNAVVVSEQVLVRLGDGESRREAVKNSVGNLTIPLLAASCTTIAAFLPIKLSPGGIGEFCYSLFAVVSLTLLSSWILSLTIIPLFCYYFLKPLKRDTFVGRQLQKLYTPYESLLRRTLRLKWGYPLLILGLTVLAGWGFKFVPNIFFPPNERSQFVIDFELPLGTDISETERQVSELERWLLTEHATEINSVASWIGSGGPQWYLSLTPEPANPNYSLLMVLTKSSDPDDVHALSEAINLYANTAFPAARVTAKPLENGPPVGDPIQIKLTGKDMDTLYTLRDQLITTIRGVEGLYDLRDDWGAWVKQVTIDPDPIRAARLGLNTAGIAEALNIQFKGITATQFRDGDDTIPVIVRSKSDYRHHPERLPDLPVFGSTGGFVPLGQVANISVDVLPGTILRKDTLRQMVIKGRVRDRFASEALADIQPLVADLISSPDWPSGYTIAYGGEQEDSAEAQGNIGKAMPVAFAILSLILIAQFNSLRRFLVIMLTIPPMLIGVVPGLLFTGSSFGFMTLLGMIALMGIIVNNAILLIDETNAQLSNGNLLIEAIVNAAKSRMRPILMTTITTIIGLLPLALGGGGMWSSMAYAMMFGLGFATLLTLLLCPCLFYLFFCHSYR